MAVASGGATPAAGNPPPSHRAPRPQHPAPRPPAQPEEGGCSLDAPVLYAIKSAPANQPRDPSRVVRVLDSGAWIADEHGKQTSGCLSDQQLAELRGALAGADFTPPPPPEVTCAAVPTSMVIVADRKHGRRASFTAPCGQPASESVHALVRRTEAWTRASAQAPAPAPPPATPVTTPACAMEGTPFYRETRWRLQDRGQPSAAEMELAVYTSGAWRRVSGGQEQSGCLSRQQVNGLRGRIGKTVIAHQSAPGPRCLAMPSHRHQIVTAHGTLAWEGPCAATTPHPSVLALQQSVQRSLGQ